MTRQTITTEHGTYLVAAETGRATVYVWTEPGQAAVHALSDIWTEIGTVRKEHVPALRTAKVSNGHDVWQPLGSATPRSGQPRDFGGRSIKLARAGTRKAAVAEVISWYERPLKRAAAEQAMEAELAEAVADSHPDWTVRRVPVPKAMDTAEMADIKRARFLYTEWRIAHDRLGHDDSDPARVAEQTKHDALVNFIEAADLNGSEWDPRLPENVHRSWAV